MNYNTVGDFSGAEITEKKSRFIGGVYPVCSEADAIEKIKQVRLTHPDANHHCYAYSIKADNLQRFSDDGEPSGTAGKPILEIITSSGLFDVLIVVTRYFGGTLLGSGGLVRAYSKTAKSALQNGSILQMTLCNIIKAQCDYSFYDKILPCISLSGAVITHTDFGAGVCISFIIDITKETGLKKNITNITNGKTVFDYEQQNFWSKI